MKKSSIFLLALVASLCTFASAQVSPFMALGNAQFLDNNGNLLTAGVLYSFAAGTTTQQATYTDYTGLYLNPNPIPFSSGARVSIWLTSSLKYKFVLCLQNDGPACAPADVLFSVDQVPGSPAGSSGSNTYTGTFISGTPNPASTGILELATTDAICWRNQAGTTNLCITKDTSDILDWTGSTIKFPETLCTAIASAYDYLCPNSVTHHLSASNNNGAYGALPIVPTPGANTHHASFLPNGIDLQDLLGSDPVTTAVTFSATPTFTATSQDQLFTMTLTANVTSSTLVTTGLPVPSLISFELTQDAVGGRTFAWPANMLGVAGISPEANAFTFVQFLWDGTNAQLIGPAATDVDGATTTVNAATSSAQVLKYSFYGAGALNYPGATFRLTTDLVGTPSATTVTIAFSLGTSASLSANTLTLYNVGSGSAPIGGLFTVVCTVLTPGSSGTMSCEVTAQSGTFVFNQGTPTVNLTTALYVGTIVQFGSASSSNTATAHLFLLEHVK